MVKWIWIDADIFFFDLNLLILITVETVFRLLGLVCLRLIDYYLQLLGLAIRWPWTRKMIESWLLRYIAYFYVIFSYLYLIKLGYLTVLLYNMLAQRPSTLVLMMINSCSYVY